VFPLTEPPESLQSEQERKPAMTLTIELPDNLEAALKAHANAKGVSEAGYVRTLLELNLTETTAAPAQPAFETGFGSLAKYGPAPTAEEIDANRADMFGRFGEDF
jgi:hypothetical protein